MKIIDKIKSLTSSKQQAPTHLDICDLIEEIILHKKNNLQDKPEDLSAQDWKNVLNDIAYAFKVKKTKTILRSSVRNQQRQEKIERAFKLFEVYFKDL
jgi:hypothetical protein